MKNQFLTQIQKDFPVAQRPFEEIARELNSSEDEILNLYKTLKEEKIIRQTSAIFDTKSLGYKSSLVAFKVKDTQKASEFINTHPGVSHNYERDNIFNLWFTIAVEPKSSLGLEKTVELMAQKADATDYIILPTKKMFKIKVQLDLTGKKESKEKIVKDKKREIKLSDFDIELIKFLQQDIEPNYKPFDKIVNALNIDYKTLQERVKYFKEAGVMRRFASILYHRRAGFNANAMVVWSIDESQEEELAKKAASFSAVSHCYLRPTYPNWPYSLFTMIHGKSKDEVKEVVEQIKNEIKPFYYNYLYSTKEFKKQRIEYFSPKFNEWEEQFI